MTAGSLMEEMPGVSTFHSGTTRAKCVPAHFTVGEDRFAINLDTKLGRIRLSRFDLARVATDKPVQFQERPKQRQRGRRPAS